MLLAITPRIFVKSNIEIFLSAAYGIVSLDPPLRAGGLRPALTHRGWVEGRPAVKDLFDLP